MMKDKTLDEFTIVLASKEPTPGGGGACALVGSLAASLGLMVTNLTIGKRNYLVYENELENIKDHLEYLRAKLLIMIDEDAMAFYPLSLAYKADKSDPDYAENLEKCLVDAANSPLNILKIITDIIEIDVRLGEVGSKLAISDAATSLMLAHGALYGAYANVLVNTRLMKDKDVSYKIQKKAALLLDKYSTIALEAYEDILMRL